LKETLTDAEWAVMSALWEKSPQTISGIIATMGDQMEWKYSTFATYVKRLCEKGFIGYDSMGRDNFYYPLVQKEQCILAESRRLLERLNSRSAKDLLVCMIQDGELTPEDRSDLKKLLEELDKEGERR
jgi:Predicted transcriptional regulator